MNLVSLQDHSLVVTIKNYGINKNIKVTFAAKFVKAHGLLNVGMEFLFDKDDKTFSKLFIKLHTTKDSGTWLTLKSSNYQTCLRNGYIAKQILQGSPYAELHFVKKVIMDKPVIVLDIKRYSEDPRPTTKAGHKRNQNV